MKRFYLTLLTISLFMGIELKAQNCIQTIGSYPYFQDFDSLSNCLSNTCNVSSIGWINESNDDIDFNINSLQTSSSNTGPDGDYSNYGQGKYLYAEATGNHNKKAILISPCFVLDSVNSQYLQFAYHMVGDDMGSLQLDIHFKGQWTQIFHQLGETIKEDWYNKYIELSPYFGDTVKFRFTATTGPGYISDIAIDAFYITNDFCNSGVFDVNITSARHKRIKVDWSSLLSLPSQIEYGPVGFIPGTGTIVLDTNFSTVQLPNHLAYDMYLRKACDSNSFGTNIGPVLVNLKPDSGDWSHFPFEIKSLPYTHNANTSNFKDLHSLRSTKEVCYRYIVEPCVKTLDISLCNGTDFDSYLYVLDNKLNVIKYNDDDCGTKSKINNVKVVPGDTIFILVEGFNHDSHGNYQIEITNSSFEFHATKDLLCPLDSTLLTFNLSNQVKDTILIMEWSKDGNSYQVGLDDSLFITAAGQYYINYVLTNGAICLSDTIEISQFESIESKLDSLCMGDTMWLHSNVRAQSYQWYKNGNLLTGDTLDSLPVILGGNYNVFVNDSSSCSDSSVNGSRVDFFHVPSVQINMSGDTDLCEGNAIYLLASNAENYQWINSVDTSVISTNHNTIIKEEGTYFVLGDIAGVCFDTSDVININVLPLPNVSMPEFNSYCTYSEPFVISGGMPLGGVYSGPLDSNLVFDPQILGEGTFKISYTYIDTNGCSNVVTNDLIVDICIGIPSNTSEEFQIFPQPANDILNIKLNRIEKARTSVQIYNALQQLEHSSNHNESEFSIDISDLRTGVYVLCIEQNDTRISRQIIVK